MGIITLRADRRSTDVSLKGPRGGREMIRRFLETLARRAFVDVDASVQLQLVRNRRS